MYSSGAGHFGPRPPSGPRPQASPVQGGGQQPLQQAQAMNPVQAAMLQMGGLVGAAPPAGQLAGGGGGAMAPGFAQFGIVPLAQLQGGAQGGLQAVPLAGLTLLTPQGGPIAFGGIGGGSIILAQPPQQPQHQQQQQFVQLQSPQLPHQQQLQGFQGRSPSPGHHGGRGMPPHGPGFAGSPNQQAGRFSSSFALHQAFERPQQQQQVQQSQPQTPQMQRAGQPWGQPPPAQGWRGGGSGGRFGSPGRGPSRGFSPGRGGGRRGEGRFGSGGSRGRGRGDSPSRGGFAGRGASGNGYGRPPAGRNDFTGQPFQQPPQSPMGRKKREAMEAAQPLAPVSDAPCSANSLSRAEKAEAARWIEERRANFPTAANVAARAAQRATTERRRELHEVLARQRALGLERQAGTTDLIRELDGGGGRGGRGGFLGGRGRFGGGDDGFRGRGGRGMRGGFRGRGRGGFEGRGWAPGGGRGRGSAVQPPPPAHQQLGDKRPPEATEDGGHGGALKRARVEEGVDAAKAEGSLAILQDYGGDESGDEDGGAAAEDAVAAAEQPVQQAGRSFGRRGGGRVGDFGAARGRFAGRDGRGRGGRGVERGVRAWGPAGRGAPTPRPRPPTLLQKLLAKDIRRGRSHLLQSFRFLVANDFLQTVDTAPLKLPADDVAVAPSGLPPMQQILDVEVSDEEHEIAEDDDAAHATAAALGNVEEPHDGGAVVMACEDATGTKEEKGDDAVQNEMGEDVPSVGDVDRAAGPGVGFAGNPEEIVLAD